jgi:hypothetical protein
MELPAFFQLSVDDADRVIDSGVYRINDLHWIQQFHEHTLI